VYEASFSSREHAKHFCSAAKIRPLSHAVVKMAKCAAMIALRLMLAPKVSLPQYRPGPWRI
jgi:hypothetical protein